VLQYDNEGTNCYKVKATYILYLFPWWGICFQLQAQRKQPTVATGSILVVGGTLLPRSHISLLHPKLQLLWPCLKQHGISTNVKQHTHALLNICINLLCRRPAQVHVLVFKCLSLSQFHSQIPKIYTFQTWYSPFSVQLLPLPWITLSPHCQCYTMPTVLSKSCSEYQNIMTQMAHEHVSNSFFIHCYTTTEITQCSVSQTTTLRTNLWTVLIVVLSHIQVL